MALLPINQPTNLKAESLQSDKNQVYLTKDLAVSNVVTVCSTSEPPNDLRLLWLQHHPVDPLNPQLTPLQPLQCAMCGQLKSTHPSGCPNYGVTCSACGIVGHKLVFCRKVIALTKNSTSVPSRNLNKKITRESTRNKISSSEESKVG